jgi:pimeloyl-ACP methyl ester carboxylesterase
MHQQPAIAFLPGLLNDEALWQHQRAGLADLAELHFFVFREETSLTAMAERVLREMPPRFIACGLSMGGYVALEIANLAPERLSGLILLDTTARADTPEQSRRRRGFIELAGRGAFKGVTPRLLPQLIHPDHLHDEAIVSTILAMAQRLGREVYIRQQQAIMARRDQRQVLPGIACPTLIMVGEKDFLTPFELALEMKDLVKQARLEVINHSGHLAALENPQAVNNHLRSFIECGGVC